MKHQTANTKTLKCTKWFSMCYMDLVAEMRQRRTFKEVTAGIMTDVSAFLEAMATPPVRPEPKGKAEPRPPARHDLETAPDHTPPPPPKKPRGEKGKKGAKGAG